MVINKELNELNAKRDAVFDGVNLNELEPEEVVLLCKKYNAISAEIEAIKTGSHFRSAAEVISANSH